jgi:hypothetical protein
MGKFIDMTGKKYGKITINRYFETRKNRTFWECTCDCGKNFITNSVDIRNGKVKSCGCLKINNLAGKKFGKILIRKYIEVKKGVAYWECQCDCGNIFIGAGCDIKRGYIKSCGCILRKDLINQKFGKLTVIEYSNTPKGRGSIWKCQCDCGNICYVASNHLQEGTTKSCGCMRESIIAKELKEYCIKNYFALTEYKELKNPKTGRYLPYDIYISPGIYIEIQGRQHYTYIKNFFHQEEKEFHHRLYLDNLKKQHAKNNGTFIEVDLREIKTIEEAINFLEKKVSLYAD